jgi:hypothetical protein
MMVPRSGGTLVLATTMVLGFVSAQEQLPPFPNATAGTFFSGVFSSGMVLQRGATPAVVYGVVIGATASTTVAVTASTAGSTSAPYTVHATVEPTTIRVQAGGFYARWRAVLHPTEAIGGNLSISADCSACGSAAGHGSDIHEISYGDVWVCSGQSNMELPMIHDHYRNG